MILSGDFTEKKTRVFLGSLGTLFFFGFLGDSGDSVFFPALKKIDFFGESGDL